MYLSICKLKLEIKMERWRNREIFCLLTHSPEGHNSQDSIKPEPRAPMEEPGQLFWQGTVPADKHKKQKKEKPRPGQGKVPTGIHLAHVRRGPG